MFLYSLPNLKLYSGRAGLPPFQYQENIRPSPFRTEDTPDMPEEEEEEEERVVRAVHMESPDTVNTNREHYHDWIMQNLG